MAINDNAGGEDNVNHRYSIDGNEVNKYYHNHYTYTDSIDDASNVIDVN